MLILTSTAFQHQQRIPKKYTCEGNDIAPPLAWAGVPEGCRSLALIVDDPDAPDPAAPKRVFVHWVLYNIPVQASGLAEVAGSAELPAGTTQGRNDFGQTRFGGPCPPIGRHRYFFKLYALDALMPTQALLDKKALEAAMRGHVLETCELVGTYQKGD